MQESHSLDVLGPLCHGVVPSGYSRHTFPQRQRGTWLGSQSFRVAQAQLGSPHPKGASRRALRGVSCP